MNSIKVPLSFVLKYALFCSVMVKGGRFAQRVIEIHSWIASLLKLATTMPGIESPAYTRWNVKTFQFTSFAWVKPFWIHASGKAHTDEYHMILATFDQWGVDWSFIACGFARNRRTFGEGKRFYRSWQSRIDERREKYINWQIIEKSRLFSVIAHQVVFT